MTRPVLLIIGAGVRFGRGHFVRMRELHDRLQAAGLSADWMSVADFDDETARRVAGSRRKYNRDPVLYIIDARDLNPGPFAHPDASVLALDNRHPSREDSSLTKLRANRAENHVEFYDTIPHPRAKLAQTLPRVLLRNDVPGSGARIRRRERSLFVYSGDFVVPGLDESLLDLVRAGWSVHRCGRAPPRLDRVRIGGAGAPGFAWNPELDRDEFLRTLAAAECVWTYFGMTLLEAWHLGRSPALLPVASDVHTELADYLAWEAGLPIISPDGQAVAAFEQRRQDPDSKAAQPTANMRPGDQGFALLIEKIRTLATTP